MTALDRGAARSLIDDAARDLHAADIELGSPGADFPHVEKLLVDAMSLTLHALGLLRGMTP